MADKSNKVTGSVPGRYYVDQNCIDCDTCRTVAPGNFLRNDDISFSFVGRQPLTPEEEEQTREALESCPVEAIGDDGTSPPA